jgi:hypothetical protein
MFWSSDTSVLGFNRHARCWFPERFPSRRFYQRPLRCKRQDNELRKLIEFDEDTFAKLKQLGRDRMATIQELADEAFADVLKKHGIPIDLKDALRKSARDANPAPPGKTSKSNPKKSKPPKKKS